MFKSVVIGIDGFRPDTQAIGAARAVAPSAQLHLATVYPDSDAQPSLGFEGYREGLRAAALETVEAQRTAAGLSADEAITHALAGHTPSRALKALARAESADLIVLGAADPSALNRVLLGDVARGVLHGAPCPVLTVARGGSRAADRPSVIGVAYDGSPESERALALATELAQELRARLEVVEAIDLGAYPQAWGLQMGEYLAGISGPERQRIAALADALPVPATGNAVHASARDLLVQLSGRVDLIVCGSRAWGPAGRIAFGSTADHLVHQAACPVLVVPRGAEVGGDTEAAVDVAVGAR